MRKQSVVIKCPNCHTRLNVVKREYFGKKERCPKCGESITIKRDLVHSDNHDDHDPGEDDKSFDIGSFLRVSNQRGVIIVNFLTSRILDQSNVQEIGDGLMGLYKKHGWKKIVLNFQGVDYMSSAVLGKLVQLYKLLAGADGQLYLCNISPDIYEIFEIMRFDQLFDIADNEDEALIQLME